MTGEIIINSEFQAGGKISFQTRIRVECCIAADYFSVERHRVSETKRNTFLEPNRFSKVEFSKDLNGNNGLGEINRIINTRGISGIIYIILVGESNIRNPDTQLKLGNHEF